MLTENTVAQWGIFELELGGKSDGNPFLEVSLSAKFWNAEKEFLVPGFYDGAGTYRLRFMPDAQGEWHYSTSSNQVELNNIEGRFLVTPPDENKHGLVRVAHQYHFAYDDGTSYYPFGTTCYAWVHQTEELQEQTLQTLQAAKFNKIRMCVFPKHYPYNENEPDLHPFEKNAAGDFDFTRFNPEFFRHFEKRVQQLGELGIEADVIIWHPYDRWGYSQMDEESDYRYLRYLIARLSAYSNVWWSLANEYDFLLNIKPIARWERFFEILCEEDPYQHLRSIHNGNVNMNYDHTKPAITHVCIQNWDVKRTKEWRSTYKKPIINDEFEYEGNIPFAWGNISAQEVVHRFWIMVVNGCYAGHGETYEHPENILWWSHGGVLHGESWQRIAFLQQIMAETPVGGLTPIEDVWLWARVSGGVNGIYRLIYFGEHQPMFWWAGLPEGDNYAIDIIDTWNMTISPGALRPARIFMAKELYKDLPQFELVLPGKPYLAVRIREK